MHGLLAAPDKEESIPGMPEGMSLERAKAMLGRQEATRYRLSQQSDRWVMSPTLCSEVCN